MENENQNKPELTVEAQVEALREQHRVQLDAAKQQIQTIIDEFVADIPPRFKALLPDLDAVAQLAWLTKAKQSGVFDAPNVPATDSSKPTVTPTAADVSSLPVHARMAAGYKR